MADWRSPLTPEELAGLACEEGVESRLVLRHDGPVPWELREGPFRSSEFAGLPETGWTLLVQGVDRLIPDVGALLDRFRFLPNWRLDDVMVSYAVAGGGVGPHLDHYDAFLIQQLGRRRWSIGRTALSPDEERLLPASPLPVLAEFEPDSSWVLAPGDMLYLPPRVPHLGVAVDPCMTYSVGFRAPTRRELVAAWCAHVLDNPDDARYADPDLRPLQNPGEIDRATLARIGGLLDDPESLQDWFGAFVTRDEDEEPLEPPRPASLLAMLREGGRLDRVALSRLAYVTTADGGVKLFAAGQLHRLPAELAFAGPLVCGTEVLAWPALRPWVERPGFVELLCDLVARRCLEPSS